MRLSKDLVAVSATIMLLRILTGGPDYGYSILRRIAAASGEEIEWSEGLLYPLLHRLERTGLVTASWGRADNGRRRKYYSITDAGRRALTDSEAQWALVSRTLDALAPLKESTHDRDPR